MLLNITCFFLMWQLEDFKFYGQLAWHVCWTEVPGDLPTQGSPSGRWILYH